MVYIYIWYICIFSGSGAGPKVDKYLLGNVCEKHFVEG